jgi:acyl carrier protein
MLKTVEGTYRNGKIELSELPQDVSGSTQVLVTFLDPGQLDSTKLCQLIDQIETTAGIQQGLDDFDAGRFRPFDDFVGEMQQKHNLSE